MRISRRDFLEGIAAAQVARAQSKVRAGAAMVNITPALGCSLAGGMRDNIATEIHDELHVRGLVLDNGKARIAMATVDSCAVPRAIFDRAKGLIAQHTGIPGSHVLLSATHSHSAPAATHLFQSQADPKYIDLLAIKIADCIRLAVGRLQPARVGYGTGREDRLVFNRRFYMKPGTIPPDPFGRKSDRVLMNPPVGSANIDRPAGPTDPEVSVLAVETVDGNPIALYASYALHYVGGVGGGHISADYFGAWAESMVRLAGKQFVPILANACSGNINGVDFRGTPAKYAPYVMMRNYADILAAESFRVWRTLKFTEEIELAASIEEIPFETRLPSRDDVDEARKLLGLKPGPFTGRAEIYARETMLLADYPRQVKTFVQAMRVGSMGIATYPGEAFVELGIETKAKSPFKTTMMVELANDYRGYLPTVEGHELGGYETWRAKSSYLEKQAAPKLVASAMRQLGMLG